MYGSVCILGYNQIPHCERTHKSSAVVKVFRLHQQRIHLQQLGKEDSVCFRQCDTFSFQ